MVESKNYITFSDGVSMYVDVRDNRIIILKERVRTYMWVGFYYPLEVVHYGLKWTVKS